MASKLSFFTLFFILLTQLCTAQEMAFSGKKIKVEKPWRISKEEFVTLAGDDDTSKALVEFYYKKRNIVLYSSLTSFAVAYLRNSIYNSYQGTPDEIGLNAKNIANYGSFVVLVGAAAYQFIGTHQGLAYTRKDLYQYLNDRKNGIALPQKLSIKLNKYLDKLAQEIAKNNKAKDK